MRDIGTRYVAAPPWLRLLLRLVSKLVNELRVRGLVTHQRNRRQSKRVLQSVRAFEEPGVAARCLSYLRTVDPLVFEEVVMSALEDAGFLVLRSRTYSGDGGIDGAFWSPQLGWYAVQVKRYRAHIELQHIRDFCGAVRRHGFNGGLFVHTGRSGAGVYPVLAEVGMGMLSGQRLVDLVLQRRLALSIGRHRPQ